MRKLVLVFFLIGCGSSLEERKFQTFLASFDIHARQLRWMDEDPAYFLEGQIADLPLPRAEAGDCVLVVASRNPASVGQIINLTVSFNGGITLRGMWERPNAFVVFRMSNPTSEASIVVTSISGQGRIIFSAYRVGYRACSD